MCPQPIWGLFEFQLGYRKFNLNSPKGYSRKIINAQTESQYVTQDRQTILIYYFLHTSLASTNILIALTSVTSLNSFLVLFRLEGGGWPGTVCGLCDYLHTRPAPQGSRYCLRQERIPHSSRETNGCKRQILNSYYLSLRKNDAV